MWRWRKCEDEQMWRWADVKMSRCEDEQMWRWADVKMRRCERRCEDEQMWRWADVKMRRCEDEKMRYRPPLLEEPCAQTLSGTKNKTNSVYKRNKNAWFSKRLTFFGSTIKRLMSDFFFWTLAVWGQILATRMTFKNAGATHKTLLMPMT